CDDRTGHPRDPARRSASHRRAGEGLPGGEAPAGRIRNDMTSTFSVDGLISGLQTRSIVDQLMSLERRPLTLLQNKQTAETNRLNALDSIKSQISALMTAINDMTKPSALNINVASIDTSAPNVLAH